MPKNKHTNYNKPETIKENDAKEETVDEVVDETVTADEKVPATRGVVVNCDRLNVRADSNLNADVLDVIAKGAEVIVDVDDPTNSFYKVRVVASGVSGFCMKAYIELQ